MLPGRPAEDLRRGMAGTIGLICTKERASPILETLLIKLSVNPAGLLGLTV